MGNNKKHRLFVTRIDRQIRQQRAVNTLVTPDKLPATSWWTTAPREAFTAQAKTAPRKSSGVMTRMDT